jgi:hypothetical protein
VCLTLFSPWKSIGRKWSTVVHRHLGRYEGRVKQLPDEAGPGTLCGHEGYLVSRSPVYSSPFRPQKAVVEELELVRNVFSENTIFVRSRQ